MRLMSTRNTTLRRFARRKNAPRELKTLVLRLRNAEAEARTATREAMEYHRSHRSLIRTNNLLRARKWRKQSRVYKLQRELTQYNFLVR